MKKPGKKNPRSRKDIPYTPGRNIFGEKAETHLIVLKRETALQQMIDAICQLDDGGKKEFAFDISCFADYPEEFAELDAKVDAFLQIRAQLLGMSIHHCDLGSAS